MLHVGRALASLAGKAGIIKVFQDPWLYLAYPEEILRVWHAYGLYKLFFLAWLPIVVWWIGNNFLTRASGLLAVVIFAAMPFLPAFEQRMKPDGVAILFGSLSPPVPARALLRYGRISSFYLACGPARRVLQHQDDHAAPDPDASPGRYPRPVGQARKHRPQNPSSFRGWTYHGQRVFGAESVPGPPPETDFQLLRALHRRSPRRAKRRPEHFQHIRVSPDPLHAFFRRLAEHPGDPRPALGLLAMSVRLPEKSARAASWRVSSSSSCFTSMPSSRTGWSTWITTSIRPRCSWPS